MRGNFFEGHRFITRIALIALIAALGTGLGTDAGAQGAEDPPPRPFESLSDTMRARSTYIFQFAEDVPPSRIPARAAALARAAGGELRHTYTEVLHGFAATMPSVALLRLLDQADDIVAFERDSVDHIVSSHKTCPGHPSCKGGGDPNPDPEPPSPGFACDSSYGDTIPWGVTRIGADTLHGSRCGQNVHVYVVDTGIDLDHPDLAPIGASVDCTRGPNCVKGGDGNDDNGHGTHVAGTIAARINDGGLVGVAPAAELHAVRVLNSQGLGFRSDIIAGINWVAGQVKNAPVVINMSLGGGGSKSGTCTSDGFIGVDSYHKAICDAARKGVVFMVAAGNGGADAVGDDAAASVPAAYDDAVITVSATDISDDWPVWSNWGDDAHGWAGVTSPIASAPVGIAAPGVFIESTWVGGGTATISGTSMATPHAAGAVALRLQDASLPASYAAFETVRADMLNRAEPTTGWDDTTDGRPHEEGFLDAAALVPGPV